MNLQKLPRWTAAAAAALRAVTAEDEAQVAHDVDAGTCELWRIDDHSYLVTNVDTRSRELIVCCYAGRNVMAIADVLYRIARAQDLQAIRFFTKRAALARKLRARFPLELYGSVFRCEVPPHVRQ